MMVPRGGWLFDGADLALRRLLPAWSGKRLEASGGGGMFRDQLPEWASRVIGVSALRYRHDVFGMHAGVSTRLLFSPRLHLIVAMATAMGGVSSAAAITVVSTFEVDGSYSSGRTVISTRSDPDGDIPGVRGVIPGKAHSFRSEYDVSISRVEVVLRTFSEERDVELAIYEADGRIPGDLVASAVMVDVLGDRESRVLWEPAATLRADTVYFLAVMIPDGRSPYSVGWHLGSRFDRGFARAALNPDGQTWNDYLYDTSPRGAMEIVGTIVPEPSAAQLMLIGLVWLASRLRVPSRYGRKGIGPA